MCITTLLRTSAFLLLSLSVSLSSAAAVNLVSAAERAPAAIKPTDLNFFESKIRPVLVEQCYSCHSAEAAKADKLKAELYLDTREGMRKGGESGPAVVPGDASGSLLIRALEHEGFEMPPSGKLSERVIADFARWVELGAPDPRDGASPVVEVEALDLDSAREFWSFKPLRETPPPAVENEAFVRNAVDRYILGRLEAKGLTPNAVAPRRTLMRRAQYGLLGLPPTQAQLAAFENDTQPDAYDRLIADLLSSPHYGERWARHWLDLARFAESHGYAFDGDRKGAHHYRDFVIRSLNNDMPYDEFIQLQLAGDLLRPGDYMATSATGFLVAGPYTTQQTAKERERSRYEQLDDMIGTVGSATLGLTVACARCHDHKFDPVPDHDYYRMISAFADVGFDTFKYDKQPEIYINAKAKYDKVHEPLVALRTRYETEELPVRLKEWLADTPADPHPVTLGTWHWIGPFKGLAFDDAQGRRFEPEKTRRNPDLALEVDGLKWEARPAWEDGVVHNTLSGDISANYLYRSITSPAPLDLEISLGFDDGIKIWLNGSIVVDRQARDRLAAPDQEKSTVSLKPGLNHFFMKIVNSTGRSGFYFKALPSAPPEDVRKVLAIAASERDDKEKETAIQWFRYLDPVWQDFNSVVVEHEKKAPVHDYEPVFSAKDGGTTYEFGENTRKVYFLVRGNSDNKKELATPAFLQVLTSAPTKEKQWLFDDPKEAAKPVPPRVGFARWLTDEEYGAGHLLARVIVNRIWQHHFGRGIVATPSDFGTQGSRPTHPDLLDYLARELIQGGWKLKNIHWLILTSNAYRQSGAVDARNQKIDPENQLFWRQPSRRLEAEVIRDALLSVSGALDTRMYGQGALDQKDPRRSIYLTVKRSALIPMLQLFDAPDAMQSIGERSTTTVSPQALAMLNSSYVRELAEAFRDRVVGDGDVDLDLDGVIEESYWHALSRPPTQAERREMRAFMDRQLASYAAKEPEEARRTALGDFCHLMLCLNEFVYVD